MSLNMVTFYYIDLNQLEYQIFMKNENVLSIRLTRDIIFSITLEKDI